MLDIHSETHDWIRYDERTDGVRPPVLWRDAEVRVHGRIIEMDADWYFVLIVDDEVEFDSRCHFRKNGKVDPRYYKVRNDAKVAGYKMLHRIVNHEIGIACDDVSRAIV